MQTQAKRNAPPRPFLAVGDRVRVRVKPRENRGAYRVTETAWTEQSYPITRIEHTDMGPLFTLGGWHGGKLVARDLRKATAVGRYALDSREARKRIGSERSAVGARPGGSALMPARIYKHAGSGGLGMMRKRSSNGCGSELVVLPAVGLCEASFSDPTYVEMARRRRALSDGFVGWHLPPCSSGAKTPLTT